MKQVQRLIGFVQMFLKVFSKFRQTLSPIYNYLQRENTFNIMDDHHGCDNISKIDSICATDETLLFAKPGLQYFILCDASFHGTGFVLLIKIYLIAQEVESKKTYPPVSFRS